MDKKELLERAKNKKRAVIGEMEKSKVNKGNWIAVIVAGVLAVAFMIVEGALKHYPAIFAIAAVCYAWASVMYICQFALAKRPWPVLFGAVLHGLACIGMIVLYIIFNVKGW